ncbi:MAG: hypothetical protein HY706_12515 [Candidatus Hydrogenedentes bacterium]|nr:hypothetical protein [Candidatus Hydrogenedentota bacterium]
MPSAKTPISTRFLGAMNLQIAQISRVFRRTSDAIGALRTDACLRKIEEMCNPSRCGWAMVLILAVSPAAAVSRLDE